MKRTILILWMLVFGTTLGVAQTSDRTGMDNAGNAASRQDNDSRGNHNWGWVGILGLAGLAGLSGKKRGNSEEARRLEARGVNVKTV